MCIPRDSAEQKCGEIASWLDTVDGLRGRNFELRASTEGPEGDSQLPTNSPGEHQSAERELISAMLSRWRITSFSASVKVALAQGPLARQLPSVR